MIDLSVNDMTCGHCASTITRAVRHLDPDARCEVDLGARRVRIASERSADDFVAALQQAGYSPSPARNP